MMEVLAGDKSVIAHRARSHLNNFALVRSYELEQILYFVLSCASALHGGFEALTKCVN